MNYRHKIKNCWKKKPTHDQKLINKITDLRSKFDKKKITILQTFSIRFWSFYDLVSNQNILLLFYSILWCLYCFIIEYTGKYCQLSKVNMSHWYHNVILRSTNLIHFYNRWFIKNSKWVSKNESYPVNKLHENPFFKIIF